MIHVNCQRRRACPAKYPLSKTHLRSAPRMEMWPREWTRDHCHPLSFPQRQNHDHWQRSHTHFPVELLLIDEETRVADHALSEMVPRMGLQPHQPAPFPMVDSCRLHMRTSSIY